MLKQIIILIFFLTSTALLIVWLLSPPDPTTPKKQNLTIEKGEGVKSIADKLKQKYLIRNALLFKILVKLKGDSPYLQAGEYSLSKTQSMLDIVKIIREGKTEEIKVTIVEGSRREEISEYLGMALNPKVAKDFLKLTTNLEGKLFPDTYFLKRDTGSAEIIEKMTSNFEVKFSQALKNSKVTGLTNDQILTLASIVERETKYEKDRPIVAGILIKRFKNNWPLEADATVQYAIGFVPFENTWWKKKLNFEDLTIDSSYNTRKNVGLPPTPIASPGLASLLAVTNPANNHYWFYLSDQKGQMHYAVTLEEHRENIRLYIDK